MDDFRVGRSLVRRRGDGGGCSIFYNLEGFWCNDILEVLMYRGKECLHG